ncbi:DUF3891 family protein [Evansella cellulosilytica]|uniref:DUF3891 family protein n=1 Tax=Evansella cellulosilytica (strain ATCC 21833 / DSM 2522 / FERM P-1141 / JCM 9156 / N-4) TaxID=649639 RepID=E6U258_EVAC2|nr:DUF3891 family protein [Evansella cellulosilytica]ADU30436.1 hypothetical protein Bcell_2175 [Evansella cellulosilytica DSM 2522]
MIITETESHYTFIQQHDHAVISGKLSKEWNDTYLLGREKRMSVELAIQQHDACWKTLDLEPLFSEEIQEPLSFINYPLEVKIAAYRKGIDEMYGEDKYAALLISKHYSSFFTGNLSNSGREFKNHELRRQKLLCNELQIHEPKVLDEHFRLLQLCDNLSLYLCMNEWGVEKEKEISWFKEGFPQRIPPAKKEKMRARWINKTTVVISPFPFKKECITVVIPYKKIPKSNYSKAHFKEIYINNKLEYHTVKIIAYNNI